MRCQRCEFENMPGLETCMRCGSILTASTEPLNIDPPRMSLWKRPIRGFFRGIRKMVPDSEWMSKDVNASIFPDWLRGASKIAFFGALLSLIPGLAHLIQRRFHKIRWFVLAWLIMLLAALALYGSSIGLFLLGLAIALHVWIAVHSALLEEYRQFGHRFMGFLLFLLMYFILYQVFGRILFMGLQGGYSVVDVPYAQVEHGDFLLGRPSRTDPADITRGSFVLVELENIRGQRMGRPRNSAYAQVIGLGGDTVKIKNGQFIVNEEVLDMDQYPVPTWLERQEFTALVPQDSYFISAQYRGGGYNEAQAISVCIVGHDQIVAKAFMRWMPLRRRGFIRGH